MDYEKIRSFLMIAECGTISDAAEKLFISQPALTYQVKTLERDLGTQLLSRSKGGHNTVLTPAGEVFVGMAKPLLEQWDEIRGTIELMSKQDRMSVVTTTSIGNYMLDEFCSDFSAVYPDGNIYINVVTTDALYNDVNTGKYDIGITYKYVNSDTIEFIPVVKERYVFVCRKDSSYPDQIEVANLNARKELFHLWSNDFNLWHDKVFGINRHYIETSGSISHIKYFFNGFRDWSILPVSVFRGLGDEFHTCTCDDLPEDRYIYMIWKKDSGQRDRFLQVLRLFQESLGTMDGCFEFLDLPK